MSKEIKCVLVDPTGKKWNEHKPGDMWLCPWYTAKLDKEKVLAQLNQGEHVFLSRYYLENWWDKRVPLIVVLPDGKHWLIDGKSTNGEGWQVEGEAPNITASPSIMTETYHGYLRNGVLTEDLEGRNYE